MSPGVGRECARRGVLPPEVRAVRVARRERGEELVRGPRVLRAPRGRALQPGARAWESAGADLRPGFVLLPEPLRRAPR